MLCTQTQNSSHTVIRSKRPKTCSTSTKKIKERTQHTWFSNTNVLHSVTKVLLAAARSASLRGQRRGKLDACSKSLLLRQLILKRLLEHRNVARSVRLHELGPGLVQEAIGQIAHVRAATDSCKAPPQELTTRRRGGRLIASPERTRPTSVCPHSGRLSQRWRCACRACRSPSVRMPDSLP